METTYKCVKIIGPYDGPFSNNVKTYILIDSNQEKIYWHEGPNKSLGIKENDLVKGIKKRDNGVIDYRSSKPELVNVQLNLF